MNVPHAACQCRAKYSFLSQALTVVSCVQAAEELLHEAFKAGEVVTAQKQEISYLSQEVQTLQQQLERCDPTAQHDEQQPAASTPLAQVSWIDGFVSCSVCQLIASDDNTKSADKKLTESLDQNGFISKLVD